MLLLLDFLCDALEVLGEFRLLGGVISSITTSELWWRVFGFVTPGMICDRSCNHEFCDCTFKWYN